MCEPEKADSKRRAEHEKKVAEQRAAAAQKRHKREIEKYERERLEDEQRWGLGLLQQMLLVTRPLFFFSLVYLLIFYIF